MLYENGVDRNFRKRGYLMEAYSVLMSVYHKADPTFFDAALASLVNQTVQSDDIVIVCDGPLTAELDAVLEKYQQQYPAIFHIVRLEQNVGIGEAANIGLSHCKNNLIAKMDADDIAVPQRCEWQLERFAQCPELTVLGGYIAEFDQDPNQPTTVREVPLTNDKIRTFARRRQPFNNTSVMYRRSAVLNVGGYNKMHRCEDFDLYTRLLHAKYYCENLSEVLVQVRVDQDALARRASMATLKGCMDSRWRAYKIGYASLLDVAVCVGGELFIALCPARVQRWIYSKFLRKRTNQEPKRG